MISCAKQFRIKTQRGDFRRPFQVISCQLLEVELQSKLNQPWVSGSGDTSKVG
jgi:hypothetical protein